MPKFSAGASLMAFQPKWAAVGSPKQFRLKMPSLPPTSPPGGTREVCELFDICELVADRYRRACICESNERKVLKRLEQQIMGYFELSQGRAARLIELSMELAHLQVNGDYKTSELEVGRMICEVTNGWVEPGFN